MLFKQQFYKYNISLLITLFIETILIYFMKKLKNIKLHTINIISNLFKK